MLFLMLQRCEAKQDELKHLLRSFNNFLKSLCLACCSDYLLYSAGFYQLYYYNDSTLYIPFMKIEYSLIPLSLGVEQRENYWRIM